MNNNYKGLIIAIISTLVVFMTVTTILIIVLIKGGKSKDDATTEITTEATTEATTTEVTTEATTETTAEATTTEEVTTEAPAPVPYAEEHGLTFTEPYTGFILPAYTVCFGSDGNPITDGSLIPVQNSAEYYFSDITKSEPDENGYVTYTIPNVIIENTQFIQVENVSASIAMYSIPVVLCDYYTGIMFSRPSWDYDNQTYADGYVYSDITWNDQTISIGIAIDYSEGYPDGDSNYSVIETTEQGKLYGNVKEEYRTYYVKAPADYDGLMISLSNIGYTEEWFNAEKTGESGPLYVLGPDACGWTYTPDQKTFIRVKDYIR